MVMNEHPYFDNLDNEKAWHATVLVRGTHAVKKIDYRDIIKQKYLKRWNFIKPFELFESFSRQNKKKLKDPDNYNDYAQAF